MNGSDAVIKALLDAGADASIPDAVLPIFIQESFLVL
jgi:hypothetical protein